jgi:hypothetical protein
VQGGTYGGRARASSKRFTTCPQFARFFVVPRNVGRAAYDALVRRTFVYSTAGVLLAIAVLLTIFGWADDTAKLPDWQALALGLSVACNAPIPEPRFGIFRM